MEVLGWWRTSSGQCKPCYLTSVRSSPVGWRPREALSPGQGAHSRDPDGWMARIVWNIHRPTCVPRNSIGRGSGSKGWKGKNCSPKTCGGCFTTALPGHICGHPRDKGSFRLALKFIHLKGLVTHPSVEHTVGVQLMDTEQNGCGNIIILSFAVSFALISKGWRRGQGSFILKSSQMSQ